MKVFKEWESKIPEMFVREIYEARKEGWKGALRWVLSMKTEENKDCILEDSTIIYDIRTEWEKRRIIIEKELEE